MNKKTDNPDFTEAQQTIDDVYVAFDNMTEEQQTYWKPSLNKFIDLAEEMEKLVIDIEKDRDN